MNSPNERPNALKLLPRSLFDLYALALPRGHGFGIRPPIGAWQSEDGIAYGVITQHVQTPDFGILVMRRRVDGVTHPSAANLRRWNAPSGNKTSKARPAKISLLGLPCASARLRSTFLATEGTKSRSGRRLSDSDLKAPDQLRRSFGSNRSELTR